MSITTFFSRVVGGRRMQHAARAIGFAIGVTVAAGACVAPPTEVPGVTPLEGRWDLAGQFSGGSGVSFQGVLTIQSTSATGFGGTVDVVETSAQGQQRRVGGPVAGRMASGTTTEFDAILGTSTRRHVATLLVDTLRGSWFEMSPTGGLELSGTFRAVRKR